MTLCPDCPQLRTDGPKRATCCSDAIDRAKAEAARHIARVLAETEQRPILPNRAERRRMAKLARKGEQE